MGQNRKLPIANGGFRLAPIPDIRKTTLSPPETSVSGANNSKLGQFGTPTRAPENAFLDDTTYEPVLLSDEPRLRHAAL